MIIAVMSDLHDNVMSWEIVVRRLRTDHIETLINCGDTCSPSMLERIAQDFPGAIHTVFGNVADRDLELEDAKKYPSLIHHGDRGAVELAGRRVGFAHFPEVAQTMAKSGEFDLVCYGHTHLKRWEKVGTCFLLNPGTAGGMFQYPSFALVDLSTMTNNFSEVTI